jgi:hypothetical protein
MNFSSTTEISREAPGQRVCGPESQQATESRIGCCSKPSSRIYLRSGHVWFQKFKPAVSPPRPNVPQTDWAILGRGRLGDAPVVERSCVFVVSPGTLQVAAAWHRPCRYTYVEVPLVGLHVVVLCDVQPKIQNSIHPPEYSITT